MVEKLCLENINPYAKQVFLARASRIMRSLQGSDTLEQVANQLLEFNTRHHEKAMTCLHAARAVQESDAPLAERLYVLCEEFLVNGNYAGDAARLAKERGNVRRARELYDLAIRDYQQLGFRDMADRLVAEKNALPASSLSGCQ